LIFANPTVSFGYIKFASKNRTHVFPDFGYDTRKVSSGKTVNAAPPGPARAHTSQRI
jgi:hypothetical protein